MHKTDNFKDIFDEKIHEYFTKISWFYSSLFQHCKSILIMLIFIIFIYYKLMVKYQKEKSSSMDEQSDREKRISYKKIRKINEKPSRKSEGLNKNLNSKINNASWNTKEYKIPIAKYQGIFLSADLTMKGRLSLFTRNLVPRVSYDEQMLEEKSEMIKEEFDETEGVEYRLWDHEICPIAALILNGIQNLSIFPGASVLYIGADPGNAISHISDIVGHDGIICVVEKSSMSSEDLDELVQNRKNIHRVKENCTNTKEYRKIAQNYDCLITNIDFADYVDIITKYSRKLLKDQGTILSFITKSTYSNLKTSKNYQNTGDGFTLKIEVNDEQKGKLIMKRLQVAQDFKQPGGFQRIINGVYKQDNKKLMQEPQKADMQDQNSQYQSRFDQGSWQDSQSESLKIKKSLKKLEHKAYLASRIIQVISQLNLQQIFADFGIRDEQKIQEIQEKIRKQTLTEKLLEMIKAEKNSQNLLPLAVKQMKQFFVEGTPYSAKVFSQERITGGSNETTQYQKSEFQFYPTYTITGFAFQQILKNQKRTTFFKGHYGISKTVSFMLYSLLSNIIAEFRFKTHEISQKQFPLKNKINNYPKLIYYSYKTEGCLKKSRKILLQQCHQMSESQKDTSLLIDHQNDITIQQIYQQKGINVVVVIDQINQFLSQNRNLELKKKETNQANNYKIKIKLEKNNDFIEMIKQINQQVGTIFYLSSVNPQKSLEKYKQLSPSKSHEEIEQIQFKFIKAYSKQIWMHEIAGFFLFCAKRYLQFNLKDMPCENKINTQNLNAQNKQKLAQQTIRQGLVMLLKALQGQYVLSLYQIRKHIKKQKQEFMSRIKKSILEQNLDKLIQILGMLLFKVIQLEKEQLKSKIFQNFNKQKLFPSFETVSYQIKINIYKDALKANKKHKEGDFKPYPINFKRGIPKQAIPFPEQLLDLHFFEVKEGMAYSLLPPNVLLEIVEKLMPETYNYFIYKNIQFISRYIDTPSFGKLFQSAFIQMIKNQPVKINFFIGQSHKKQWIDLNNNNLNQYHFRQIPKFRKAASNETKQQKLKRSSSKQQKIQKQNSKINQKKNFGNSYNFYKEFQGFISDQIKQLIQQCSANKDDKKLKRDHTFLFTAKSQSKLKNPEMVVPFKTVQGKIVFQFRKNDNSNKCIDLILLNVDLNSLQSPLITFNVIDVTVTLNQNENFNKIKNFLEEFCCFKDMGHNLSQIHTPLGKRIPTIKLNYFVLSPATYRGDLKKQLQNYFQEHIRFQSIGPRPMCRATQKNKHKNQSILNYVGIIRIGDECNVEKTNPAKQSSNQDFALFKQLQKIIASSSFRKAK